MGFLSRIFGRQQFTPQKPSATAAARSATWPFDQTPATVAITTRQVLDDDKEVLAVVHYSDDHSWAFVCGTTDAREDGRLITMAHALEIDPTLASIADLPPGWKAFRETRGGEWVRSENEKG